MEESEIRVTLRLPQSLRDRLTEVATANGRSMNGEIVQRLKDSLILEAPPLRRMGYSIMPDDVKAEDVAEAIELANKQAVALALSRLGIRYVDFPEAREDEK